MKKSQLRLLFTGGALVCMAISGLLYFTQTHKPLGVAPAAVSPEKQIASGLVLTNPSATQINILSAPTKVETGTPVTENPLPAKEVTQAPVVAKPIVNPVFDENAARLGTTLSLLLSTWGQGGVLPHQLANTAAQLAAKTGQTALASAAADLRRATPREGPATLALLLVEMDKALALNAPEGLPDTTAEAVANKSWFRKQLELFIHISAPDSKDSWKTALLTTQQLIARGAVNDAANVLDEKPLAQDARLNPLRMQIRTYLLQNGRLTHTITTYANTFLFAEEPK